MNDMPAVYNETFPKARKQHKCCECHRDIQPGEKYQRSEGLWEGEWMTFKTCMLCYDLRKKIAFSLPYDEAPAFGELREWAQEADIEFPPKAKAEECKAK
jgi:hypothetical protein